MYHITEESNLSGTLEDGKETGWAKLAHCEIQCLDLDREKAKENRCVCIRLDAEELDFYKILRTQIQHRCKKTAGIR